MLVPAATCRIGAVRASTAAFALLAAPSGRPWQVQSVFRAALNIATPRGLLTIADGAGGGLPNGLLVDRAPDFRTLGLRAGMAVETLPGAIAIPAVGLRIAWAAAERWSPELSAPPDGPTRTASRWRARSETVWHHAQRHGARGGFAGLLSNRIDPGPFGTLSRALEGLDAVTVALRQGDRLAAAGAAHAARNLIGLGAGLTPSGDDALVGIEAALHALDHPRAGFLALALDDVDDRTSAVAASFLRHAAAGRFAERLHDLLRALLAPDDRLFPAAVDRAVVWGASSGTDSLLGVLRGLDDATAHPALSRSAA